MNKLLYASALKEAGLKITQQRIEILNYLLNTKSHPSVGDVYKKLKKTNPGLSLSTVYNTIEKLLKAGKISKLNIEFDLCRLDGNSTPHSHFYCERCNHIFDIEHNIEDLAMTNKNMFLKNSEIKEIDLTFKGICAHCAGRD